MGLDGNDHRVGEDGEVGKGHVKIVERRPGEGGGVARRAGEVEGPVVGLEEAAVGEGEIVRQGRAVQIVERDRGIDRVVPRAPGGDAVPGVLAEELSVDRNVQHRIGADEITVGVRERGNGHVEADVAEAHPRNGVAHGERIGARREGRPEEKENAERPQEHGCLFHGCFPRRGWGGPAHCGSHGIRPGWRMRPRPIGTRAEGFYHRSPRRSPSRVERRGFFGSRSKMRSVGLLNPKDR